MTEKIDLRRRYLLAGTAAATGLAVSGVTVSAQDKPLPDYVSFKKPDALIVHSNNTIETRRDAFGTSLITPEDKLYIRNNVSPPDASIVADRDAWEVSIEGVAEPRALTVGQLKSMGLDTVAMVLQCSGNGRAFFDHNPSGTQWKVGAAGNVIWTGVPLRKVVDALGGPAEGMKFITGTGGETIPADLKERDVVVERSVPIDVLDTVLLAWDLNGEPVSLAHGGPLRMIVPGYTGVNNVKYLKRLALTAQESDARIQQSRYRLLPVGEKAGPQHPSVWAMPVKSFVTAPLDVARAGAVQVTGFAFGGINPVQSVEVSTDGGKNWQKAEFIGPDLGRYAWRSFALSTDLQPGTHLIVSRATDSEGNVQPKEPEPNNSGYNHNGWRDHGVEVAVS
ncbi:SorT family sulfite dehydrogenase catalytic subunit [Mesorhizobium sp. L-8-3]|uniref:SorT family sulfite dehydrogenase catalytic subunit n=1 Tax=Mesorhizobium sp. L-8-3 TaxID=2744522 RepID=UPI00192551D6|nr:sulfite oxidase [Mesorhizobium sp. L-8-3]BCH24581.1 sulfite oxidase [Mesorhizobium sp. L-8-3]